MVDWPETDGSRDFTVDEVILLWSFFGFRLNVFSAALKHSFHFYFN